MLDRHFDGLKGDFAEHPERALVVQRITKDMSARLDVLLDLGLGYLTPDLLLCASLYAAYETESAYMPAIALPSGHRIVDGQLAEAIRKRASAGAGSSDDSCSWLGFVNLLRCSRRELYSA
jgi:hypothetical protein